MGEYNLLCKCTIKAKIYCYKVSSETRRDFFGVSSVSFSSDAYMIVQCLTASLSSHSKRIELLGDGGEAQLVEYLSSMHKPWAPTLP